MDRYAQLMPSDELRGRYIAIVNGFLAKGDALSAFAVAENGVKNGAFRDPWQRPEALLLPGIVSSPFLDPKVGIPQRDSSDSQR